MSETFYTVEREGKLPYSTRGNLVIAPLPVAEAVAKELGGRPVPVKDWRTGCCIVTDPDGFTFYPTNWRDSNEGAN